MKEERKGVIAEMRMEEKRRNRDEGPGRGGCRRGSGKEEAGGGIVAGRDEKGRGQRDNEKEGVGRYSRGAEGRNSRHGGEQGVVAGRSVGVAGEGKGKQRQRKGGG